jgi:hypothetical protein
MTPAEIAALQLLVANPELGLTLAAMLPNNQTAIKTLQWVTIKKSRGGALDARPRKTFFITFV